jgi:hypothetical protein
VREFDLKSDMPPKDVAVLRLRNFLKYARTERIVKIIHGYGSHGIGGGIREAIRAELADMEAEGSIAAYIPGEAFTIPMGFADVIDRYQSLVKGDPDYRKTNEGVTFVVLK